MLVLLLALATPARGEPLEAPYRECSQQTLEEAIALERLGDCEALRDHVRSFGCKMIWPREGLDPWHGPQPREGRRDRRELER
jgi:hypothetical protein